MSNLQSAKSAIKAEIAHAREGLAFYQTRIDTLERTLDELDAVSFDADIDIEEPQKRVGARRGRPARKQRIRATEYASGRDLPPTGAEYWMDLITDQPQTAAEILRQAVGKLGFEPDSSQVQKLRQRVSPALKALLDGNKIHDTGSGRERRYSRA